MSKVTAIVVAGGSGKRMGMNIKKQYIILGEKEILAHTLEAFNEAECIDEIVVVVSEEEREIVQRDIVDKYKINKVSRIAAGGKERQDSVYNGLMATDESTDYVMIHDGARPFISRQLIERALEKTKEVDATVVAVPVKDTIKVVNLTEKAVENTPKRETLWSVQTPQSFKKEVLLKAYEFASKEALQVTDDSMLVEAYGKKVYIVEGEYNNIKVTTPEDLIIGNAILAERQSKNQ